MKLLLDTHILLWSAIDKLPASAAEYILDGSSTLYFSPASIWEVVIKRGLNRPDFRVAFPFCLPRYLPMTSIRPSVAGLMVPWDWMYPITTQDISIAVLNGSPAPVSTA